MQTVTVENNPYPCFPFFLDIFDEHGRSSTSHSYMTSLQPAGPSMIGKRQREYSRTFVLLESERKRRCPNSRSWGNNNILVRAVDPAPCRTYTVSPQPRTLASASTPTLISATIPAPPCSQISAPVSAPTPPSAGRLRINLMCSSATCVTYVLTQPVSVIG